MSKKTKVEISKVAIKIGETEHELSLAQVQELRDILNDAFPTERHVVHHRDWTRPTYWDHWYPRLYGSGLAATNIDHQQITSTNMAALQQPKDATQTLRLALSDNTG